MYVKVVIENGEEYFRKALRVNPRDKLVKKGLGEVKEMSKK
jgi:hypothetical protein